jgi:hypothetical protein
VGKKFNLHHEMQFFGLIQRIRARAVRLVAGSIGEAEEGDRPGELLEGDKPDSRVGEDRESSRDNSAGLDSRRGMVGSLASGDKGKAGRASECCRAASMACEDWAVRLRTDWARAAEVVELWPGHLRTDLVPQQWMER